MNQCSSIARLIKMGLSHSSDYKKLKTQLKKSDRDINFESFNEQIDNAVVRPKERHRLLILSMSKKENSKLKNTTLLGADLKDKANVAQGDLRRISHRESITIIKELKNHTSSEPRHGKIQKRNTRRKNSKTTWQPSGVKTEEKETEKGQDTADKTENTGEKNGPSTVVNIEEKRTEKRQLTVGKSEAKKTKEKPATVVKTEEKGTEKGEADVVKIEKAGPSNVVKTEKKGTEEEKPLEILQIHKYFQDVDINSFDKLDYPERIEAIYQHAQSLENDVDNFNDEMHSLTYFVLDEKLMRILEKLDKIKCSGSETLTKSKLRAVTYIDHLHKTLDLRAKT